MPLITMQSGSIASEASVTKNPTSIIPIGTNSQTLKKISTSKSTTHDEGSAGVVLSKTTRSWEVIDHLKYFQILIIV